MPEENLANIADCRDSNCRQSLLALKLELAVAIGNLIFAFLVLA